MKLKFTLKSKSFLTFFLAMILIGIADSLAQTYTFTNAGASGTAGPSQGQVNTAYTSTTLDGQVTVIGQGIQEWVVPFTGAYSITGAGASGGYTPNALGGKGRIITTEVNLTAGEIIRVLVGQEGGQAHTSNGYSGGGGGGTFIINQTTGNPILICGGGGGAGDGIPGGYPIPAPGVDASAYNVTSGTDGTATPYSWDTFGIGGTAGNGGGASTWGGAGGGGYLTNGTLGTYCGQIGNSYLSGGLGGINQALFGSFTLNVPGGFGGGAGGGVHTSYEANGGGGGGYSGGGGSATRVGSGGGGGNFYTGTYISSGLNTGNGQVVFTSLCTPTTIIADNPTLPDIIGECSVSTPIAPTATNNCGLNVTGTTTTIFPISNQGITTITWNYDDGYGNTLTQFQNIVIDDVTPPVPDLGTLTEVTDQCIVTSLTAPSATDNCAGIVTVINDATLPITAQGTTVVTWTYDDGNGNTSTQTQNVIITDITSPVPDSPTLPDIIDQCEVTSLLAPLSTDNCAGIVTVTNDATFPITTQGITVVTWTYDDGNGNTSTQTQNVIITDITSPVPDLATLLDITNQCEVTSLLAPLATDNCAGIVTVTNDATFPITTQGTTVVTWTYDDGNGNTSTQTQNVIISAVDVTTTLNNNTITSNNLTANSYQWINCDSAIAIPGATSQSYTATVNGNYAVVVTYGTCSDTSLCVSITGIGIIEANPLKNAVYPNPNNGVFDILSSSKDTYISIYSIDGKEIVNQLKISSPIQHINISKVEKGVYFIKFFTLNQSEYFRFIVE